MTYSQNRNRHEIEEDMFMIKQMTRHFKQMEKVMLMRMLAPLNFDENTQKIK
ncbi:hypothetical protein WSSLDB02_07910 [Weissella soli]|jgi:hypothetical protein|uniref:Uncharacterized protein n=1 Tax=Weissella soli TaxID=155866 RepID=A0A288Q6T7_9LACO|nr:hypothetical protein WSWS_01218 [Weissella soli]RDL05430.1 hypothetical protein DFP99_1392 [Weissella soli]GEN93529.1 hypothetical protein WSO01_11410 [Weissella soli]GJM48234.1 hypothetical protein WSSLDB02_07910 [Weissella soli]